MAIWETFKEWFLSLGDKYNVNPYIFGGIYIGAIPFFFYFLGRTIKNIRNKKPIVFPLLRPRRAYVLSRLIYTLLLQVKTSRPGCMSLSE